MSGMLTRSVPVETVESLARHLSNPSTALHGHTLSNRSSLAVPLQNSLEAVEEAKGGGGGRLGRPTTLVLPYHARTWDRGV